MKKKFSIFNFSWSSIRSHFSTFISQLSFREGFTLIELIVVMTILGVFATFLIGSYQSSQARGRDSKRKLELKQIATAIEAYHADAGVYPCGSSGCGTVHACDLKNRVTLYMTNVPLDPLDSNASCFSIAGSCKQHYVYWAAADGSSYTLYANLENANDSDAVKPKSLPNGSPAAFSNAAKSIASVPCSNSGGISNDFNYWINNQ